MLTREQYTEIRDFNRSVPCPFCRAEVGRPCRTASGTTMRTHYDRWKNAWTERVRTTGQAQPWLGSDPEDRPERAG